MSRRQILRWSFLLAALVIALVVARTSPVPDAGRGPDAIDRRAGDSEKGLGSLREAGDRVLVSAAGLRYVPGSREGHRLRHVLLHTADQPDRPGQHGVFSGGRDEALAVIDEAYQIARERGPPTRIRHEDDRTIYTVDMGRPVGYIGGQSGGRRGHPVASHVRLVLRGKDVITAFPLIP